MVYNIKAIIEERIVILEREFMCLSPTGIAINKIRIDELQLLLKELSE